MIIRHRINTSKELANIPSNHGAEIDLRLFEGEIILAHDPFTPGEKLNVWLQNFHHGTLILNVKEDGLENHIVKILQSMEIDDYFFLDQPFPTLRKSALANLPVALRLSENENPIEINDLKIKWIWLDSFSGNWSFLGKHAEWLRNGEFKLCLVSPELQGRSPDEESFSILKICKELNLQINAVCTKYSAMWEKIL